MNIYICVKVRLGDMTKKKNPEIKNVINAPEFYIVLSVLYSLALYFTF